MLFKLNINGQTRSVPSEEVNSSQGFNYISDNIDVSSEQVNNNKGFNNISDDNNVSSQ